MSTTLSDDEVWTRLEDLPHWSRAPGAEPAITARYELTDFADALAFVNRVGAEAEVMNHHPDIDIRWNTVTLTLSTHSAGGLTDADFRLAHRISELGID